ncbi:MAG: CCA tRNA nucleotidyltransferase [Verrucomicrobiota bacterium]
MSDEYKFPDDPAFELARGIRERASSPEPHERAWKGATGSSTPDQLAAAAYRIVTKLQQNGHTAFLAGGCVRDKMLHRVPKDYDIATNARPRQIRQLFDSAGYVGAHFGVVLVREPEGVFEIATFRTDGIYLDGRHPRDVRYSDAEGDSQRRDFTINGLFFDPSTSELIDYVGGCEDLQNQTIRAIGDPAERFMEDHLRLMRAVRFAEVLGFEIEPATLSAIKTAAHSIRQISVERVRDELIQILEHPNRIQGFDLLVGTGLLSEILPEVSDLMGCQQPPEFHPEGDVFVHTRLMLSLLEDDAPLPLILSVLFHDIAKPATYSYDAASTRIRFNGHAELGAEMTAKILKRFRFSNDVIDATVEAVANHMKFKDVQQMRVSTLKRFMSSPTFDQQLELHRVDCKGSNGNLENYEFVRQKREEFGNEPLIPPRLISGQDLMAMGMEAGPRIGEVLDALQTAQLEGQLSTREDALQWLGKEYGLAS